MSTTTSTSATGSRTCPSRDSSRIDANFREDWSAAVAAFPVQPDSGHRDNHDDFGHQQAFQSACAKLNVIELGVEFSTRDAGEAGAALRQKIEARLNPKTA
jgi:hypothetical protein